MRSAVFLASISLAVIVRAGACEAQVTDQCAPVLSQTRIWKESDLYTFLALSHRITNDNYEQYKEQASANGVIGAAMFSGNYEHFKEVRNHLEEEYNLHFTQSSADVYAAQYLPTDLAQAWVQCLALQVTQAGAGFHMWPGRAVSPDRITIFMKWAPLPDGDKLARLDAFTPLGVVPPYPNIPKRWRPNQTQYVTFMRSPSTAFSLDASVGGVADHVDAVAPLPPPPHNIDEATLGCGTFTSGAVARAHEPGQSPPYPERNPELGQEHSARTLPFEFKWGRSIHWNGVDDLIAGKCTKVESGPMRFALRIDLSSEAKNSTYNGGYAWAHWSPTWQDTLYLPENGLTTQYKVKVSYDNRSQASDLPSCTFDLIDEKFQVKVNASGEQEFQLRPGKYLYTVSCPRSDSFTNVDDEHLTFTTEVDR